MSSTVHERPGVYSSYDASTIVSATGTGKTVGLVAAEGATPAGQALVLTRQEQIREYFGGNGAMSEMAALLLRNGAAAVVAVPVEDEDGYEAAFAALEAYEDISLVVCESTAISVQQALRQHVAEASAARRERIGVVCGAVSESVSELTARAAALNSERMVLVAPAAGDRAGLAAAAVAGAIAGERDPAVPLSGAVLKGLSALETAYGDNEIDLLVRGGVTPLESIAGEISVVRGVTTRTKTGEAADATWRELSTIRIVDDVIPAVRTSLRGKFARAKNTAQSRGAIRSQVVLELENRLRREIITGYDAVTVTASEENPTVCLVDFSFTVTHGLNQIWLTAHITV